MYTGDAGGVGRACPSGRMMVPRGKMLGGSSGINYMAYVRGHPGDFDAWADGGAKGWGYDEVLPYFKKSEGLQPSGDIVVDHDAHNPERPARRVGARARIPRRRAVRRRRGRAGIPAVTTTAATAAARGRGVAVPDDHPGRQAVLDLPRLPRAGHGAGTNLDVVTHAHVTRVLLEGRAGGLRATGVEYRDADGARPTVTATKEVVLCAGAIGSPQLLLLSGIGPKRRARRGRRRRAGSTCPTSASTSRTTCTRRCSSRRPASALTMAEVGVALGPDALRAPVGPLPADPADDADLPPELAGAQGRGRAAAHRVGDDRSGAGLVLAVRRRRLLLHRPRRPAHPRRADRLRRRRLHARHLARPFRIDPDEYFDGPATPRWPPTPRPSSCCRTRCSRTPRARCAWPAPTRRPAGHPLNYFADPHDVR